jgi:outer membrane protein assembly factor BamB
MRFFALLLALQSLQATETYQLPAAPSKIWSVAWQKQLVPPSLLDWHPQELGGPAIDPVSGMVIVGTRDGRLHCRDFDGARVWDLETGGRIDAPPRIDGNRVYFGSTDGKLYAVSLASGKVIWTYDTQEEVGTTPVVAGGLVLVMTLQDSLVAVDAQTGAWKWHHRREVKEGFTIRGAASVMAAGGLAIGAYSDGAVAALDLATGGVKWERSVAPEGNFMDVDSLRLQGGRLYAAAYSGAIYALEPETGRQIWEVKAPGASRLTLSGGLLLAVTATQLLGIDAREGAVRWTLAFDGVPTGSPVILNNGLAAVPNAKGLLFVDTSAGHVVRVFNPGTGVSSTPAWLGQRVYVLSNAGDLLALDLS